jgi:O-antigen/teichoic acid export membrane protein
MDYSDQVGKNFAWLSVAQFATRLLGAAFYIFLSFKLLATGLGEYGFVSSFVPLWFLFSDFGISSYLYREWSRGGYTQEQANRDYNIMFAFTSTLVIVMFVVFLGVNFFINHQVLPSLILFFFSVYLSGYAHVNDLYLQSTNYFRQPAIRQVIEKLTVVILGGALLLWRANVTWLFLAVLVSQFVSYFYYIFGGFAFKIRFTWDSVRIKQLVVRGLPFLLLTGFTSIYSRIDMVMLRYLKNFDAVGLYGAAYKFMDVAVLFSSLFLAAVFPILTKLHDDKSKLKEYGDFFDRCLRIIFSSSILVALFFIFAAPLLFKVFFPESFSSGILAMRILIIAQVITFVSLLFNNLIIVQNRERVSLYIVIFGACMNVALNFILIPKFSIYGAAWATVIAEVFNLFLLQHFAQWKVNFGVVIKMVILTLVNSIFLYIFKQNGLLNVIWIGVVFFIANILALLWFDLLRMQDVKIFINPFLGKLSSVWPGSWK